MITKMINYIKMDFCNVAGAMRLCFPRLPMWVIVVWYILMVPIGLLLFIPAMIWKWWVFRQIRKMEDYLFEVEEAE